MSQHSQSLRSHGTLCPYHRLSFCAFGAFAASWSLCDAGEEAGVSWSPSAMSGEAFPTRWTTPPLRAFAFDRVDRS